MDERGRCAGNVTLTRGRGSVELVKRGDEVWVKPDRDFWEAQLPGGQGTAAADTLHGRYVHGSPGTGSSRRSPRRATWTPSRRT